MSRPDTTWSLLHEAVRALTTSDAATRHAVAKRIDAWMDAACCQGCGAHPGEEHDTLCEMLARIEAAR